MKAIGSVSHGVFCCHWVPLCGLALSPTLLSPCLSFMDGETAMVLRGGWNTLRNTQGIPVLFAVSVNGQVLEIEDSAAKSTKRSIKLEDGSSLEVEWQLYAPEIGPYVLIRTGVLANFIYHEPPNLALWFNKTTLLHFGYIQLKPVALWTLCTLDCLYKVLGDMHVDMSQSGCVLRRLQTTVTCQQ
jgi:hypothetical protein